MKTTKLLLVMLFSIAVASCGGGGGDAAPGPPAPTTLLTDNFSSGNLNNWTIAGAVTNSNTTFGNPPPSMFFGSTSDQATSVADFNFTSGLTFSFYNGPFKVDTNASSAFYGGINSGTSASPGRGAGFVFKNASINCYLNGSLVNVYVVDPASKNYMVKILPDGRVQYFVDSVLIFTSVDAVSFTSPRGVLFTLSTTVVGTGIAGGLVDNVLVTAP